MLHRDDVKFWLVLSVIDLVILDRMYGAPDVMELVARVGFARTTEAFTQASEGRRGPRFIYKLKNQTTQAQPHRNTQPHSPKAQARLDLKKEDGAENQGRPRSPQTRPLLFLTYIL